jgi:hypothetical protein
MGIIGSFEGWVPNPQDLYYNGVNSGSLTVDPATGWNFENTRIHYAYKTQFGAVRAFTFGRAIDVRSYSKLILEGRFLFIDSSDTTKPTYATLYTQAIPEAVNFPSAKGPLYSMEFDITQVSTINSGGSVTISSAKAEQWITRIRLA